MPIVHRQIKGAVVNRHHFLALQIKMRLNALFGEHVNVRPQTVVRASFNHGEIEWAVLQRFGDLLVDRLCQLMASDIPFHNLTGQLTTFYHLDPISEHRCKAFTGEHWCPIL